MVVFCTNRSPASPVPAEVVQALKRSGFVTPHTIGQARQSARAAPPNPTLQAEWRQILEQQRSEASVQRRELQLGQASIRAQLAEASIRVSGIVQSALADAEAASARDPFKSAWLRHVRRAVDDPGPLSRSNGSQR